MMNSNIAPEQFEFRRQIDGLVYRFRRQRDAQRRWGYKRTDGDDWIIWSQQLGRIAGSWDNEDVFGRPWDQLQRQSNACPPEGIWVSRKG